MKAICVVTVTLNAGESIRRLIDSLRKQTDRSFEYVVVDGASTDDTCKIIHESSDVITYSTSEPDRGLYDALNKAVHIASKRAEYYLVLGADDILYPEAIENYKSVARRTDADVVVAGVKAGGGIRKGFHRRRAWLGHSAMITSHSVGMMFRCALHDRFGEYSLRYPLLADGHFIKRVCTADGVRVAAEGFTAGEFGLGGISNKELVRALCETWQIQNETGENRVVQYLLFQMRLLRFLPRVLARSQ